MTARKKPTAKKAPPARKAAPAKKRALAKKTKRTATPAKKPARPVGRPTGYTPEIAAKILAALEQGTPLAVICREEGMPAVRTVSDWKKARPAFSADFARAREEGFDALAAQCLEIADDSTGDDDEVGEEQEPQPHGGSLRRQHAAVSENVQRAKLRIDTRLKLLAKWDPKRYGDKVQLAQAEDMAPLTVVVKQYSE